MAEDRVVADAHAFMLDLKALIESEVSIREEAQSLTEELDRSYEDLYLFTRVATQIKSLRFSPAMLRELIHEILETMRVDLAFARLTSKPQYNVVVSKLQNQAPFEDEAAFIQALVDLVPEHAPPVDEACYVVNDSADIPALAGLASRPFRLLTVRIRQKGDSLGWMTLVSFNMREIFRRSEHRLLGSMAEQLALVIANSDLYQELEHFVINVVKSLVQAIEAKDTYTRGHSERVSHFSMLVAGRLGLDDRQKSAIQWASILHDVGKIGIPEGVLNKPGRLNDQEYALVKKHPVKGTNILAPIVQLGESLPAILHHHERYDGQGYPDGLAGERIPLGARIIAVADTFDAITSNRAYRRSLTEEDALRILDSVAGTQLDAAIVRVFREIMDQQPKPAGAKEEPP